MSASNVVKLRHQTRLRLVSYSGERMHHTLDAASVAQPVEIHQRLGRRLVGLVFTAGRDQLMTVAVAVGNRICSFVEWNLNMQTTTD